VALRTETEPAAEALTALESQVRAAQRRGDPRDLPVLGFGEISCVLRLDDRGGSWAAKRLPPFPDLEALADYRRHFESYLRELAGRGVRVLPSHLRSVALPGDGEALTAYCLQPLVEAHGLGPSRLAACDEGEGRLLFEEITAAIRGCVGPTVGLDGQLSNWVWVGGTLAYLDVTTPLLRDAAGRELLDTDLFLASLPWALRGLVRRFWLSSILDKYYDVRGVLLDLLGNLHKEQLRHRIPGLLEGANQSLEPPLTLPEVTRYYRSDARLWRLLQVLRRVDRWQQRLRGHPYPFLLPGTITR
jgi:hypothetical protein